MRHLIHSVDHRREVAEERSDEGQDANPRAQAPKHLSDRDKSAARVNIKTLTRRLSSTCPTAKKLPREADKTRFKAHRTSMAECQQRARYPRKHEHTKKPCTNRPKGP